MMPDKRRRKLLLLQLPQPGDNLEISPGYFKPWLDLFISFRRYPGGEELIAFMEMLKKMKSPNQRLIFANIEMQQLWGG